MGKLGKLSDIDLGFLKPTNWPLAGRVLNNFIGNVAECCCLGILLLVFGLAFMPFADIIAGNLVDDELFPLFGMGTSLLIAILWAVVVGGAGVALMIYALVLVIIAEREKAQREKEKAEERARKEGRLI